VTKSTNKVTGGWWGVKQCWHGGEEIPGDANRRVQSPFHHCCSQNGREMNCDRGRTMNRQIEAPSTDL